jgi:hypothetical protein
MVLRLEVVRVLRDDKRLPDHTEEITTSRLFNADSRLLEE